LNFLGACEKSILTWMQEGDRNAPQKTNDKKRQREPEKIGLLAQGPVVRV